MKKHLMSLLAAILLVVSLSNAALATNIVYSNTYNTTTSGITPRASLYLKAQTAWCTTASGGNIQINFQVTATSKMSSVGATNIYIYEKNGQNWTEVAHFSSGTTLGMLKSSTSFCSSSVTFKGTAGVQYKATVTAYAGNSSTAYDSIDVQTAAVTAIK